MMIYGFLGGVGRVIQILGFVVIFVFYSGQSLAYTDLKSITTEKLILERDSSGVINHIVTLDLNEKKFNDLGKNIIRLYNHNSVQELYDLAPNAQIDFCNATFDLKDWSQLCDENIDKNLKLSISFSIDNVNNLILNQGREDFSFWVLIGTKAHESHGYTYYHQKVTVSVEGNHFAHISGLEGKEIKLPKEQPESFCVSSTTGNVKLEIQSKNSINSPSEFQLQIGSNVNTHKIGYKILVDYKNGNDPVEVDHQMVIDKKWKANLAKLSDTDCKGGNNMELLINMIDEDVRVAPPGTYQDTITFIVSPA